MVRWLTSLAGALFLHRGWFVWPQLVLVVASLFNLMKGRTTLMVAHRLTTISRVDKILVLQDGRLMEEGSPAELKAKPGYYARVISGQVELE